ncbi:hypothetical protein [Thiolapillus sp.]
MKIFSTQTMVLLAILAFMLLTSGCATVEKASKNQKMHERLKAYAHEVRWGALEALPAYLRPAMVAQQKDIAKDPANIRVTEYEVVVPPSPAGENQIVQTARINYLFRDRQVVRTLVDQQSWEYEPETKQWFRINTIPAFE